MRDGEDEGHERRYEGARAGDPDAFAELFGRHADELRRFVDRRLGDQARRRIEPDDVVQETSLVLFERIRDFPPDLTESELRAWCVQVTKHVLIDMIRAMGNDLGESALPERHGIDGPTPRVETGSVTRADGAARLRRAIERLPEHYAAVVRECVLGGRSAVRAAERLGITPDNVRQRLCRANERLRELLREA